MDKKNKIIDRAFFAVLLAGVSAVTLYLFYRQCTGNPGLYHSDMKAYILEMQGLDSGYSFPYPVLFKLSALIHLFTNPELAVAIATMLLNSGAMVVTKLAFNRLLLSDAYIGANGCGTDSGNGRLGGSASCSWLRGVFISVVSVSLFFISMLYPPAGIYLPGIKFNYLGVFTANPFHNATYMAARPFAILAFLWFVKLLPVYESGLCKGKKAAFPNGTAAECGAAQSGVALQDYICFSVFLLLATMTKPSFTLIMVSTAGLVMLYRLVRSGFHNFVPTAQLGICFIPTFLHLLYQYKGVFVPEDGAEGGVGFCFGEVWAQYCDNIPLAVCLAVGFPLLVLVLNFRECRKNTMFLFSWQLFAVSFLEAFLLYEKGFRKPDFNFSWGYMYGIFFCHFGALAVLMSATVRQMRAGKAAMATEFAFLAAQWLAYLCHLLCGLVYFKGILAGGMYY